jgi:hypothetical protein
MDANMARPIVWLCLACLTSPLELPAQTPADSLTTLLQEARQQRWIVRATISSGVRHEGLVTGTIGSTFAISGNAVQLPDITVLQRKV